jgi:uncharacterized membrane protein (UPF0127 family)
LEVKLGNKKYIVSFSFLLNLPFLILFNPYRKHENIIIENKEYKMYIVESIFSQMIGYRFRSPQDLEENEIMLFKFKKENEYSFWMKNVYFPIKLCSVDFDFSSTNCIIMQSNRNEKHKINGNNIIEFPFLSNDQT